VTESAGTPVQNGTVVTFTSSFGTIEPNEARTHGGKATVRFVASSQSGTARVGAFSGASVAEALEVLVGGAAAARIVVRADPQTIPATGGSTDIVATVVDAAGNPLRGVPVTFTTTAGQLSAGQAITEPNGEARARLTAPRSATVTATAGSQTATVEVTAASPAVTITPPATGIEAGVAATFTITPVSGTGINGIRDLDIDFGDGTAPTRLGAISGATPVAHTFARPGAYTVRATVTDTQGITATSSIVVNVNEQSSVPLTMTASPNPVSVGSPTFQGIVNFTMSAGGLGGGTATISSYTWDFGDGFGAFTTGASTNHRYITPGTYIATVSVRTTTGVSGFTQLTVRVNP
jgi:PKD repeat protein